MVEVSISWGAWRACQRSTVQQSRSPGSPGPYPFLPLARVLSQRFQGLSLLGSPCKRASIPAAAAAWVEQEAGSEEAAVVSQTAPTVALALAPGGDRALASGLRFAEYALYSQAWLRTALASLGASQVARAPVLLCHPPFSLSPSFLLLHFFLFFLF